MNIDDGRYILMSNIQFDYSGVLPFAGEHEVDYLKEYVKAAHEMLHSKTGAGNDFLGWVGAPWGKTPLRQQSSVKITPICFGKYFVLKALV